MKNKIKRISAHILCGIMLFLAAATIWAEPYYLFNLEWVPRVMYVLLLFFTVVTTVTQFGWWWEYLYPAFAGLIASADIIIFYSTGEGTEKSYLHFIFWSEGSVVSIASWYCLFILVIPFFIAWMSHKSIKHHNDMGSVWK